MSDERDEMIPDLASDAAVEIMHAIGSDDDPDLYGAIQTIIAARIAALEAERDAARAEVEAMQESGSWHREDVIDRLMDEAKAARAEGYRQGIEDAAQAYYDGEGWDWFREAEDAIRALTPPDAPNQAHARSDATPRPGGSHRTQVPAPTAPAGTRSAPRER